MIERTSVQRRSLNEILHHGTGTHCRDRMVDCAEITNFRQRKTKTPSSPKVTDAVSVGEKRLQLLQCFNGISGCDRSTDTIQSQIERILLYRALLATGSHQVGEHHEVHRSGARSPSWDNSDLCG